MPGKNRIVKCQVPFSEPDENGENELIHAEDQNNLKISILTALIGR